MKHIMAGRGYRGPREGTGGGKLHQEAITEQQDRRIAYTEVVRLKKGKQKRRHVLDPEYLKRI